MKRLLAFVSALVFAATISASSAAAGIEWCATDPVFELVGTATNVKVKATVAASPRELGGIDYVVTVTSAARKVTYSKGSVIPQTVTLTTEQGTPGTFSIVGTVFVSGPDGVAVEVTDGTTTFYGKTNELIQISFGGATGK